VAEVCWSRCGDGDCIRLAGVAAGAEVSVRPASAAAAGGLPPMAGQLVRDGADLCFVPRFGFADGTTYAVTIDGGAAAVLTRPRPDRPATTEVTGIWPTAAQVPCNLLRIYVWFSAPMSDGYAGRHVRVSHDGGETIAGALLAGEHELWDASRLRLTVLLDPARIKRGLPGHRAGGYPLRPGEPFRLEIDAGFRDAQGIRLRAGAGRRYQVGREERRHVDPASWPLTAPPARTAEPLRVSFGRPLDHGLLSRCLEVAGPAGQVVDGEARIGDGEQSWQFLPRQPWSSGPHQLIVDPVLEDLAGNSVGRVFDRNLSRPEDRPRPAGPITLAFRPR
jgi:hypothetical protein